MGNFSFLSSFLEEVVQKHGPAANGCIVMQDGKILFEEYHGTATPDTLYRQFSTTKISTCVGALTLFERGAFLMNDPVSDYIPEWKNATIMVRDGKDGCRIEPLKRPVLIRDLFSMSMGLGYGGEGLRELWKVRDANPETYTIAQQARDIASVPLFFEPGSRWLYGVGHDILAGLIEILSGKRVDDYLNEAVFGPLGMKHTAHHYNDLVKKENLTQMYHFENGVGTPAEDTNGDRFLEESCVYDGGGSGLIATVRDYAALMNMLACGGKAPDGTQVLSRKTIDMMRTNRLTEQQLKEDFQNKYLDGFGYGFGVRTFLDPAVGVNASVGTFGWTGAAGTLAEADPSEKLSYVYMHNMLPNNEAYIHPRVRNMIFGAIE